MSSWAEIGRPLALGAVALSLACAPFGLRAAAGAGSTNGDAVPRFGFGKPATAQEIAGWDIDVRPDGKGLPPGRGTVAQGQAVYDAKCASCHGTFGESTDYMPLAGGVGTLGSEAPIRTTGSKLNHATTLWDYINRAMPFGSPKTLSADEVYALTAYVLHLNDILPAEASLDRESMLRVKLPNRDGFTTDHGFAAVDGKADTRNVACMRDCVPSVRVASDMPEHARDAHGNLAEQVRDIGPIEGVETARAAVATTAARREPHAGSALARSAGCTACHGIDKRVVGPAFEEIRGRYATDGEAESRLVARVKAGGVGTWGAVPMPPQPQLKDADVKAIVQWILAGAR